LHLKSLTLKGFKSFAQSTTLQFEPGVTAVVGPNGSGKSNVVDALAWVMGEQGVKSLRGAKMEDVIFAGTSSQAPLGRASVELVIDNSDGALPIDYTEVSISRTLFRNGASEYAINGDACRLLDVQELLSDSGLGREMHVIVGQGQLDSILRADPMERRGLIEEAAGVLKYRRRKERSERKLEAMQGNLQRLNDLISEVGRQLKPLAKQAEVAKRANQIGDRLKQLRSELYSLQLTDLNQKLSSLNSTESEKRAEREILNQQLESTNEYIKQLEQSLLAGDTSARELVFKLEGLASRAKSSQSILEQKIQNLKNESEFEIDTSPITEEISKLEAEINTQLEQSAEYEKQLVSLSEKRENQLSEIENIQKEFQLLVESAQQRASEVSAFESETKSLEGGFEDKTQQLSNAENQLELTKAKLSELREQLQSMTETLGVGDEQTLKQKYQESQASRIESQQMLNEKKAELQQLSKDLESNQARLSALQLGMQQTDGSEQLARQSADDLSGFLAEHIKIDAGYQAAVAAALGEISDALVAPSMKQAIKAANKLGEQQLGRALIVIIEDLSKKRSSDKIEGFDSIGNFFDGPQVIQDLVRGIVLIENMDQAESAFANKELVALVTTNGEIIRRNQLRAGKQSAASKVELVTEAELASEKIKSLGEQTKLASEQVDKLQADFAIAEKQETEALENLRALDAELAIHAEKSGRLRAQIESTEQAIESLTTQKQNLSEQVANLSAQLAERLEGKPELIEIPAKPEKLEQLEAELNAVRAEEFEKRVELGGSKERVIQLQSRISQLKTELESSEQKLTQAQARKAQRAKLLENLEIQLEKLPELTEVIQRSLSQAREKAQASEEKRTTDTQNLAHHRTKADEIRASLSSSQAEVQSSEMKKHELSLSKNGLLEKISDELGVEGEELLDQNWQSELSQSELTQQLRQAKSDFAQLGQFNPMALEQLDALEQRHQYLKDQLADVENARKDLRGIITDLDEQVREIFESAFEDTQKAFAEIFPILFPGGQGSMRLTQAEDSLESGVDVSVRPAGKKIDKLSLLSGGERSLAAVAMLMAIFIARPSPFYVLDEVEAALDDSNLGRLLEVLSGLRESSQLVIITHQKRTMEIADVLYGVSMKQDGITKVVSQKLEQHG